MLVRREWDTLKPSLIPALTGEHHPGVVSGKGDSWKLLGIKTDIQNVIKGIDQLLVGLVSVPEQIWSWGNGHRWWSASVPSNWIASTSTTTTKMAALASMTLTSASAATLMSTSTLAEIGTEASRQLGRRILDWWPGYDPETSCAGLGRLRGWGLRRNEWHSWQGRRYRYQTYAVRIPPQARASGNCIEEAKQEGKDWTNLKNQLPSLSSFPIYEDHLISIHSYFFEVPECSLSQPISANF